MNIIRPISEYGIGLIIKDGIEFFRTKKSIKRFNSEEILSRFITHKSEYVKDSQNAEKYLDLKYTAFLPHPGTEISVFRTLGINLNLIGRLGKTVAKLRSRKLIGRAELKIKDISELRPKETTSDKQLEIKAGPLPFSHSNILNFPDLNDTPQYKAQQKLYALKMASVAGKLIKA